MKCKIILPIILVASFFIMVSHATPDEKTDMTPTWRIVIKLDIPELQPQAFQWTLFDEDPAANYVAEVTPLQEYYEKWLEESEDRETEQSRRMSAASACWTSLFKEISGDRIHLWTAIQDPPHYESNNPYVKYWFATAIVRCDGEPVCWSIPFEAKLGDDITIILNRNNALDLLAMFNDAMAVVLEKEMPDTTFGDEPAAHALYDRMIEALNKAETMYFESECATEVKGKKFHGVSYRAWLKKPNYARIEASKDGKNSGILVGDGEQFWVYWPNGRPRFGDENIKEYEKARLISYTNRASPPGHHSLAHMTMDLGVGMTILQLSRFHGCRDGLDGYLDGVRTLGAEEIQGEMCDLIEVSYMNNQRSKYFWLSRTDFLPRKLKEVVRVEYTLVKHEIWSNVKINIEVPDEKFHWLPPANWIAWYKPSLASGLLKFGTQAPDFAFSALNGNVVRLSDYRGKIVLVNFWRVGCPPCREEIPFLEKLYRKYKDQGLMVIGYNSSDDNSIAVEMLERYFVTYPNIIDHSIEAKDMQFNVYQNPKTGQNAVPLNYVINREGKIADAWYGYSEGDTRALEVLKKLGIE